MTVFIVIIGISLLILIHELGHFIVAKKMGLLVEEFGFGFPPRLFSKKAGETTYSFNLLPFGGFVKIYGEDAETRSERAFCCQPVWKRAVVVVAGVAMNFFLGWLLISAMFMVGTPKTLLVADVLADTPAAAVGLMPQDQISGFNTTREFIEFVNKNRGKEIVFDVIRQGEKLSFAVTPRMEEKAAIGVTLIEAGVERQPFLAALWRGLAASANIFAAIVAAFVNLVWGLLAQGRFLTDFVGPIGIFGVAQQAGALGFLYLVQLIALISLNLTVLNILPFPALDGGRLLFLLIEKIKGSPLNPGFERGANAIGFALLILLMIAITARDIVRLF